MFAQQNCTTAAVAAAAAEKRRRIAKLTLDSIRATNDPHVMTIYYFLQQIIINNNNNINKLRTVAVATISHGAHWHFTIFHSGGKLPIFPQQIHRSIARLGLCDA